MGFVEEIGKALGYYWSKKRKAASQTANQKHSRITSKFDDMKEKVEELYLRTDPKSGKTMAKIFWELNRPEWYWLETHMPKEIVDHIKRKSNIPD